MPPALLSKMANAQKSKEENDRPTSGKHFARGEGGATSQLTQNYKNGKKVEALMKKLAAHMKEGKFEDETPHEEVSEPHTPIQEERVKVPRREFYNGPP